jgi:hypothetical protein
MQGKGLERIIQLNELARNSHWALVHYPNTLERDQHIKARAHIKPQSIYWAQAQKQLGSSAEILELKRIRVTETNSKAETRKERSLLLPLGLKVLEGHEINQGSYYTL